MDSDAVSQFIAETFEGVDVLEAHGYLFFFYDPGRTLPSERRFPFVTVASNDNDDEQVSNLSRPGVYRLNIGVAKPTYRALFGAPPAASTDPSGVVDTGYDYTAIDQLMPHPHYAPQSWVCILSPSAAMFDSAVKPLLAEAYEQAVRKYAKSQAEMDA